MGHEQNSAKPFDSYLDRLVLLKTILDQVKKRSISVDQVCFLLKFIFK